MADGWGATAANGVLAATFNGTAYVQTAVWIQLHTGSPGANGTSSVATNNTRKDVSTAFGTPSGGSLTNTSVIGPWTAVPATETYSHATFWSASTGGAFICSATLVGDTSVVAGDSFSISVGGASIALPVAS